MNNALCAFVGGPLDGETISVPRNQYSFETPGKDSAFPFMSFHQSPCPTSIVLLERYVRQRWCVYDEVRRLTLEWDEFIHQRQP